ncbi:MAG: tetratricopeptide repeat-containing sensor histidine kinase [Winogradskyella sp.]|nr:tetratricopeptide repeat-containing sensor histidine kinase [Winogradskyella sp.]
MKQLILLAAFLSALFSFAQNERIDSLTIELAYQTQDSAKVDTSLRLIKELYDIKDYKKALVFVDQTSQLAKRIDYISGLAESSYYRALIYNERDDYFNAIDSYEKSRSYYRTIADSVGIAKVSNKIGLLEIKRGNYASGLTNSLFAIKIFEEKGLTEELSLAYNNLGEAYFKTNQIDKALEFNTKALSVREILRDSTGIKQSMKNIALLYSKRKEHRKAIEYYERILAIINRTTDADLLGDILPRVGNEYLQFRDYDKAAEYLLEGLRYNRQRNSKEGILKSLNAIGKLNLRQNKVRLAAVQLDEAYAIAKDFENSEDLLENYKLHVELDSTRGFYQNAFFWQNKYYDLKERLSEKDSPTIILEQTASLPLEETENVTDEPINNGSSLFSPEQNRLLLYGLLGLLLLSLLLIIINYAKYSKSRAIIKEYKEKLADEKKRNDAILEQTYHLEEINNVKDKLFSIVSHDLKDSISSIKAFIDLLREDGISQEEFNELIPELSENANNASSLLFNLLNWSKSQLQNLEPKPELFNIQDVFQTKISLIDQKLEDKRIVLIDESQRANVYADKSMIEIVIQNLLTNAVKFSRTGDVITVSNTEKDGNAVICVEDTGVGISEENLSKLFAVNSTFTTIGTKNEKGTGLGLTICKDLVELNNGRIWVESTQNVGSKFFVELPKVEPSK